MSGIRNIMGRKSNTVKLQGFIGQDAPTKVQYHTFAGAFVLYFYRTCCVFEPA